MGNNGSKNKKKGVSSNMDMNMNNMYMDEGEITEGLRLLNAMK
jgi:hypothetical protein